MFKSIKATIFVTFFSLLPIFCASAIDFDQDGYDDFVLIDVNSKSKLEWYAIDVNDNVRRSLGQYGSVGDHLAVGNWSGDNRTSRALVQKKSTGYFEWDIDLPGGEQSLTFGSYPSMVISGLDADKNGAIDPAILSASAKTFYWKVMLNPALQGTDTTKEFYFGSRKDLPFYANFDGTGDQIATAKVNKKHVLTIRYKNVLTGKVRVTSIGNFQYEITKVVPIASSSGKDQLYIISKSGSRIRAMLISGKKKIKLVSGNGDEVVVGKYLGDGSEILAIRNTTRKSIFVDSSGKKSSISIDLEGILVDEVNINSFNDTNTPGTPSATPTPAAGNGTNPACSGTAVSTEHLLYKPVSDTSGNAVIVFDGTYKREFLSVKIELKDGTFADGWWKGLELWGNPDSNGPRQHWRTNVRSNQVKDNALIIAQDVGQECRYTLPGSASRRWE